MNISGLITTKARPSFPQNRFAGIKAVVMFVMTALSPLSLLLISGCNKTETHHITPWFKSVRDTSELKVRDLNINRHVVTDEYFILRDKKWIKMSAGNVTFVPPSVVLIDGKKILHEKNRQPLEICEKGRLSLTPDSNAYDCTTLRYDARNVLWIYVTRFDLHGKPLREFTLKPGSRLWGLLAGNVWAYDEQNNPYFLFRNKGFEDQTPGAPACALFTHENDAVRIHLADDNTKGNQCEDLRYWMKITEKTLRVPPAPADSPLPPLRFRERPYHFDRDFPMRD